MEELAWPWLLTLVFWAGIIVIVIALAISGFRPRPSTRSVPVANLGVVTIHPRFRRRLRQYRVLIIVGLVLCLAAVVAGAFVAARTVATTSITPETKNRDIVLCLDVSGSMAGLDSAILETFETLAADFTGERVGLVIFDGSPLQVFPLTTDYDTVSDQLERVSRGVGGGSFDHGTSVGGGISIIGDGVAGCLLQFDRLDEPRSRTVILGTDYRSADDPMISTTETTALAVARNITIHGLNPAHRASRRESASFEADVRATGGLYFTTGNESASAQAIEDIVAGVVADEATAVKEAPIRITTDVPDRSIWIFVAVTFAALGVMWRVRL